jgi:hypothetical protein
MKFAAPPGAKPYYELRKVLVTVPGKGAFEDLVQRQIEAACRTGTLGGMDPLDIRLDKRSPDSASLAINLVKNFGFKLDVDSKECYFDTRAELKRRALVELEADRLIETGEAQLVGHAVAKDGSPCSFYVVTIPPKEEVEGGEKSSSKLLADGDMFRVKESVKDGSRTILDEKTGGYREDLHACNLMRREVEYDAVLVYHRALTGTDLPFNSQESAHLAPTAEEAMERWQQKEPWAGIQLNVRQEAVVEYTLRSAPQTSLTPSLDEQKKVSPPPIPTSTQEKVKAKTKKVAVEKTVEKEGPKEMANVSKTTSKEPNFDIPS